MGDGAVWGCGSQHRGELCPPPMGSRRWGPPHRPGRLCRSWTALGQEEEALATAAPSESPSTHRLPRTAPVGHVSPLSHQSPTAQGKHPGHQPPLATVPRCRSGGEPPRWALPGLLTSTSGAGHGCCWLVRRLWQGQPALSRSLSAPSNPSLSHPELPSRSHGSFTKRSGVRMVGDTPQCLLPPAPGHVGYGHPSHPQCWPCTDLPD